MKNNQGIIWAPALIMVGAVVVAGFATYFLIKNNTGDTRENVNLVIISNLNTNTTNSNTNPSVSVDEYRLANFKLATCYISLHPDILESMPQNDLTKTYEDYAHQRNANINVCAGLDTTNIEVIREKILTDADGDGIVAFAEDFMGTSDLKIDTDDDGYDDYETLRIVTASEENEDTDGDGLTNINEVAVYNTNPLKADSDGDSFSDRDEICNGYSPNGTVTSDDYKIADPDSCNTN